MKILVLNAGSSSLKIALYEVVDPPMTVPSSPIWEGSADWDESPGSVVLHGSMDGGNSFTHVFTADTRAAIVHDVLQMLWSGTAPVVGSPQEIAMVGHRVVHGGPDYLQSTIITPAVKAAIARFTAVAPTHNRFALEDIATVDEIFGATPQVAAFDTAFHAHLPPAAAVYPGPYAWFEQGIHRYGFHGLSHRYCAERAAKLLGRDLATLRLITCHLGSGCSLAAIREGSSIETTMGFTPFEGVMMNTRSGSVDPGVLLYLLQTQGYSAERLDREITQEAGLLGISGVSEDLRQILVEREAGNARARLAFDMYVHRLSAGIGSMLAALGGADALVFTGGVGEHLAEIRAAACAPFAFTGLMLDDDTNRKSSPDQIISTPDSTFTALVIHTEEEWMIARDCWRLAQDPQPIIEHSATDQHAPGDEESGARFQFDVAISSAVPVTAMEPPQRQEPINGPLAPELLERMQRYWQAANYLTIGQIYLQANPLLREPLRPEHIKPRLLGHWGTSPGLSFIYVHLNRLITEHDVNAIYLAGPGHGGPALVANTYLEGTYSEIYPNITRDEEGMHRLFRQFSTPGGIPSHVSVTTPGSIHEGGELGYVLTHAFGAAFDHPDLIVAAVVGDGEAETGPLAGSWKGTSFLNPARDGAVLPILHLNGYKISGPTVLGRAEDHDVRALLESQGYEVHVVETEDPVTAHQLFAATLEDCYIRIREIQQEARAHGVQAQPRWPAIVLRTPKGWTGPAVVDGLPVEGTFRAHQVPLDKVKTNPEHLALLEEWMRSYAPERLFDAQGRLLPDLAELAPLAIDAWEPTRMRMVAGWSLTSFCPIFATMPWKSRSMASHRSRGRVRWARCCGMSLPTTPRRQIFASSARMRRIPTGWMTSSRSKTAVSLVRRSPSTIISLPTVA